MSASHHHPETHHNVPPVVAEYMSTHRHKELYNDVMYAGWAEKTKIGKDGQPMPFSEDAVYAFVDQESGNGIYGVFDGAGGMDDGRGASEAARQYLHEYAMQHGDTVPSNPRQNIENIVEEMVDRVAAVSKGATTGVIAMVHKDREGGQKLAWAGVGDSLLFVIRGGRAYQLNREETQRQEMLEQGKSEAEADRHGNVITNALGSDTYTGLNQTDVIQLYPGDQILLVSDGVTGDTSKQRLRGGDNMAAIEEVMNAPHATPQQKAEALIEAATKNDDRSAMIIQIDGPQPSAEAVREGDRSSQRVGRASGVVAVGSLLESVPVNERKVAHTMREYQLHRGALKLPEEAVMDIGKAREEYGVNGMVLAEITLPAAEHSQSEPKIGLVDFGALATERPTPVKYVDGRPAEELGVTHSRYALIALNYMGEGDRAPFLELSKAEMTIGRQNIHPMLGLTSTPDGSLISRRHFTVEQSEDGKGLTIRDHSTNGTRIKVAARG